MIEINQDSFEKELQSNSLVVLDFYSTECPPCEAWHLSLMPSISYTGRISASSRCFARGIASWRRSLA